LIVPLERAMLVFYRLSVVTIALSLTVRPQFAIEYLLRSNQQGQNFRVFSLDYIPDVGVCKERTPWPN